MKKNKGFTLTEMLVVLAAISVLIAIAFPTFRNSKTEAGVKADIQSVSAAYAAVKAEYDIKGKIPEGYRPYGGWPVMEQICPGKDNPEVISELYGLELGNGWDKGDTVIITVDDSKPENVQFIANYS